MSRALSLRHAGAVALLVAATSASGPAKAQEFFHSISNWLGVTAEDQDDLDYHERAPLVVPPDSGKLPAPQASIEQRNPKWPVDPEIAEKRRKAAQANSLWSQPSDLDDHYILRDRTNAAAQKKALGRLPDGESTASREPVPASDQTREYWLDPRVLTGMRQRDEPKLAAGVEPPRRSLTDPPVGARLPAAGAPVRATQEKPDINGLDDGANGIREYQRQVSQP